MTMSPEARTTLTVLLAVLDFVAISRVVWRSQGVERTLAWIFAILAFPGVGAGAYFLFANQQVRRTALRRRSLARMLRDARNLRATCPRPIDPVLRVAAATTGFPPTTGNRVELLAEDERAFDRIEGAIRGARRSVWAEYYIVRRDETGRRFLSLLAARAKAGAEVRLLYDAVGSMRIDPVLVAAIRAAGGSVASFHPPNPFRRRWSYHLRNHRKLVIVDGQAGFTGGMNVGDEYSGRKRRRGSLRFRDMHMFVRGPACRDLADLFAEDWAFATGRAPGVMPEPVRRAGRSTVSILPSGPEQERNASAMAFFATIGEARKRLYLTSPYFIPDEPTLRAMENAALRGVDVRLMVPERSDVLLVGPAGRSYFPPLLRAGIRIFQYRPSMLHAKTLVADGKWGLVGSANLDIRSMRFNFELGMLVTDSAFATVLERRFVGDCADSREITLHSCSAWGTKELIRQRTARLLSPLL